LKIYISQSSVFSNHIITNFSQNVPVKKLKIGQYGDDMDKSLRFTRPICKLLIIVLEPFLATPRILTRIVQ